MNNKQLATAFVDMVNGKQKKKPVTAHNMSIDIQGENLVLMSYYTPIAVYNSTANYVVVNNTFLSASTAKHQSKLNCSRFECPVSIVLHFGGFCGSSYGIKSPAAYTVNELLEQTEPLYYYDKLQYLSKNGRIYYRWTLYKAATAMDRINGNGDFTEIHRYTNEQAAKDETNRLNILACGQLANL